MTNWTVDMRSESRNRTGRDNVYIVFVEKIRLYKFQQHNVKNLFSKNGAYSCKQRSQEFEDTRTKYINLKFLR